MRQCVFVTINFNVKFLVIFPFTQCYWLIDTFAYRKKNKLIQMDPLITANFRVFSNTSLSQIYYMTYPSVCEGQCTRVSLIYLQILRRLLCGSARQTTCFQLSPTRNPEHANGYEQFDLLDCDLDTILMRCVNITTSTLWSPRLCEIWSEISQQVTRTERQSPSVSRSFTAMQQWRPLHGEEINERG